MHPLRYKQSTEGVDENRPCHFQKKNSVVARSRVETNHICEPRLVWQNLKKGRVQIPAVPRHKSPKGSRVQIPAVPRFTR